MQIPGFKIADAFKEGNPGEPNVAIEVNSDLLTDPRYAPQGVLFNQSMLNYIHILNIGPDAFVATFDPYEAASDINRISSNTGASAQAFYKIWEDTNTEIDIKDLSDQFVKHIAYTARWNEHFSFSLDEEDRRVLASAIRKVFLSIATISDSMPWRIYGESTKDEVQCSYSVSIIKYSMQDPTYFYAIPLSFTTTVNKSIQQLQNETIYDKAIYKVDMNGLIYRAKTDPNIHGMSFLEYLQAHL